MKERIQIENIEDEDIESFKTKYILSESERHYYRYFEGEPYRYNITIKSCH